LKEAKTIKKMFEPPPIETKIGDDGTTSKDGGDGTPTNRHRDNY
jgi:hypothetical protein